MCGNPLTYMQIHWMFLVPGLLVLFYPLDTWLGRSVRFHDYEYIRNSGARAGTPWWHQRWVWLDPLRAFVGGWLLRHSWAIEPPLPGLWSHLPLMATAVVMGLALAAQMHTRRDGESMIAPIGYVAGLLFVLLPPQVAVLVVVMAGACLMAFRGWSAFFLCGALGAAAFGFMILRFNFWLAVSVVLMIEPLLLSVLAQRQLLLPVVTKKRVAH
jgi:hypothetical protein